jgi:hypothetical protein
MGGQIQPGMNGMQGQNMQGSINGGMAGQYQPQNPSRGGVDYAARQRQLLNTHLQAQGQLAMQAAKSSGGGFLSRVFGGPKASSTAVTRQQQATAAKAGQAGKGGLFSNFLFGKNQQAGAADNGTYRSRRSAAYSEYKKQTMERSKMEKDMARRQRLAESSKSSRMQRFHASKLEKMQKSFEKGEKSYKKSYLGYKYTK